MKQVFNNIKKKMNKKNVINGLLFVLLIIITFYFVFKKSSLSELIIHIREAKKSYIFVALMCMFMYVFLEGLNIYRIMKNFKDNISIVKAFKYSLVGFFFSSITPSSTGGQPMQLYFMNKDKLPLSHGTLALLIQLLSFQFVTLVLAIIGFIAHYDLLLHHIGNIKYLLFFGISINILIESFLIIMIFSKNMGAKLIKWFCNVLKKFRYKKADLLLERGLIQLDEYHSCALYLNEHKWILVKTMMTSLFQMCIYHSIPYFIYRAFGLNDYGVFTFIFMQAVLYISVASLPFPGSMGVSEGSFMIIFKMFFPASLLGSAMIISRGISFYLFVLISLILILTFMIVDKHLERRHLKKLVEVGEA